jgi:RNA polymerase sigma factor (sigma-70 family)
MASAANLLPSILDWVRAHVVDGQPDRELLGRFTRDGDGQAFAALLRRHGPMVLAACRRILPNTADAEDVLQKTFLLLAQKAARLRDPDSVGSWLYGVAYRLALRARSEAAVRADREGRTPPPVPSDPLDKITRDETQQLIDEALARLPEQCRAVLVLCCLEGRTQIAAARQLGCSLSTLKRRLEEGRTRLGQQLVRHGLTLPAAALAATLAPRTDAALPPALTAAVLRAVTSVPVAGLAGRVVGGLLAGRLRRAVAAVAIAVAVAAGGVAIWATSGREEKPGASDPDPAVPGPVVPRPGFDLAGDPLPDGAVARIGTTRFRLHGAIGSLAFTADGRRLVSLGADDIRVWDVATGREQRTRADFLNNNSDWRALAWSSDGKWAATTDPAGATIWDLTSGKKVKDLGHGWYDSNEVFGHVNDRTCLAPDGRVLALARNNAISTWDVATGKRLATWQHPQGKAGLRPNLREIEPRRPISLAFTGDGKTLMTDGAENAVFFWEAATGNMLRPLHGIDSYPSYQSYPIALSADGKVIAGCTPAVRNLCIFDAADGKVLRRLEPPLFYIWRLAFSPDGKVLACSARPEEQAPGREPPQVVYLWDAATGKELHCLAPCGLKEPYGLGGLMAFSPDSKKLAVTLSTPGNWGRGGGGPSYNNVMKVYDVASGRELPLTAGLPKPATRSVLAPDGKTLATICGDSSTGTTSIWLWDTATGEQRRRLEGHEGWVNDLLFSPDGRTLFSTDRARLRFWEVATGRQVPNFDMATDYLLACSPDGKRLAVSGAWLVRVIDTTSGECVREIKLRSGEYLHGATFLPDGQSLVVCAGRQAHVYDVTTGEDTRQFELAMGGVSPDQGGPAFSRDGRLIAFDQDGLIKVHKLADGAEVCRSEKRETGGYSFALSPDGRTVAWGIRLGGDRLVHLLDVATGKERHTFAGHQGGIETLTFSADGKKLVSGSSDATLLVWDMTAPQAAPGAGQPAKPIAPRNTPTTQRGVRGP